MRFTILILLAAAVAAGQNPVATPSFPATPTDAQLYVASNEPVTVPTLTSSVNNSTSTWPISDCLGYLAGNIITVDSEKARVSAVGASSGPCNLTVVRGTFSGYPAASHSSGGAVHLYIEDVQFNVLAAWIKAIGNWAENLSTGGASTNGTSGQVLTSNGGGGFGTPLTVGTDLLAPGSGTSAGYIDVYPPNDTTHPVGWQAPATRSTQVRLVLPSADPAGQVLTCATPSGSPPVSACTWTSAGGSMTYPSGTGIAQVAGGASWGTTLSLVTTVGVTGSDTSVPTEQAVREAITAVETGVHGDIDLPAGSMDSGSVYVTGTWKFGSNGLTPQVYGGVSYYGIKTTASSEYFRADFRLPSTWTGSGVTVKMATIDVDGNPRTVTYTAEIGCTANGDNVYNTQEPTYGSTATLTGTQASNGLTELSASLSSIPAACTAGAQARLKIIRGSFSGNHGVYDVSLVW